MCFDLVSDYTEKKRNYEVETTSKCKHLSDMQENVRQSNLQLVFWQTIYLKKKRVNFTQDRVLLSVN